MAEIKNVETNNTPEQADSEMNPAVATGVAGALIAAGYGLEKLKERREERKEQRFAEKEEKKNEPKKGIVEKMFNKMGYEKAVVSEPEKDKKEKEEPEAKEEEKPAEKKGKKSRKAKKAD